jgi:hypothetical protein
MKSKSTNKHYNEKENFNMCMPHSGKKTNIPLNHTPQQLPLFYSKTIDDIIERSRFYSNVKVINTIKEIEPQLFDWAMELRKEALKERINIPLKEIITLLSNAFHALDSDETIKLKLKKSIMEWCSK